MTSELDRVDVDLWAALEAEQPAQHRLVCLALGRHSATQAARVLGLSRTQYYVHRKAVIARLEGCLGAPVAWVEVLRHADAAGLPAEWPSQTGHTVRS